MLLLPLQYRPIRFLLLVLPQLVTTTNTFTPPPLSSTTSVSVMVETASGCTATETLDMFLNEITSSGNIGQASATVCVGEIHRHLQTLHQLQE